MDNSHHHCCDRRQSERGTQALDKDEYENSLLHTAPFNEQVLIDFTVRLFDRVREMGLFDDDANTDARLIAGTIYYKVATTLQGQAGQEAIIR